MGVPLQGGMLMATHGVTRLLQFLAHFGKDPSVCDDGTLE
jgi:hypothetical protein